MRMMFDGQFKYGSQDGSLESLLSQSDLDFGTVPQSKKALDLPSNLEKIKDDFLLVFDW